MVHTKINLFGLSVYAVRDTLYMLDFILPCAKNRHRLLTFLFAKLWWKLGTVQSGDVNADLLLAQWLEPEVSRRDIIFTHNLLI